jgi:hypothetical protein
MLMVNLVLSIAPETRWRCPVRRADNLTTIMCRLSENSGNLNLMEPSRPVWACTGKALPYRRVCSVFLNVPLTFPTFLSRHQPTFRASVYSDDGVLVSCNLSRRFSWIWCSNAEGDGIYLISAPVQPGPRAHPTSYTPGTVSLSPGLKRPGRGVNHPPPSSAFMASSRATFTFTF